jgi:hypothetical protein
MKPAPKKRARDPRPGLRGPGSKPSRARSVAEFSEGFETVRSDRDYARTANRQRAERRKDEREADGTAAVKRAELNEAKDVWSSATNGTPQQATPKQKALVRAHEDAIFFAQRRAEVQTGVQRVHVGFTWPGGWVVEGKYWRDAFVEKNFRTWRHPFFQRVLATSGRAARGRLMSGPSKNGCVRQWSKLHGSDQLYSFFCTECRDMFRLDCEKEFVDEAQMRSWLAHRVEETGAPCMPHMAIWISDDRFPGKIIRPHFLFLLPEGHAVWPTSPSNHHRLLQEVIAALTAAFECDPGGLANPFHGKNPVSPLTDAVVIQDTCMPTLGEYADHMSLSWDPETMLRRMMRERLEAVDFDRDESNTWFSLPATLARAAGKTLFKAGLDTNDFEVFRSAIVDTIRDAVMDAIRPAPSQVKTVEKMIDTCAKWTAANFDPKKMHASGRDRGGAAHLIAPGDDLKTRRRKGQQHACTVKIAKTHGLIVPLIRSRTRRGHDTTRTQIAKTTGRAYNTVKRHEFECTIEAIAPLLTEISTGVAVEALFRGFTQPRPTGYLDKTTIQPSSERPVASLSGFPPPPDPRIRPSVARFHPQPS